MEGLILDTSTPTALLCLASGGSVANSHTIEGGRNLSERLFPTLSTLLEEVKLNYISVGVGPGSYMGVRTAASIAKTLAFAYEIPLIPFPSPLAFLPPGLDGSFAFSGDAKMGQHFLLSGNVSGYEVTNLQGPTLKDRSEIPSHAIPLSTPNLEWLSAYTYTQFLQGNHTTPRHLKLTYLR